MRRACWGLPQNWPRLLFQQALRRWPLIESSVPFRRWLFLAAMKHLIFLCMTKLCSMYLLSADHFKFRLKSNQKFWLVERDLIENSIRIYGTSRYLKQKGVNVHGPEIMGLWMIMATPISLIRAQYRCDANRNSCVLIDLLQSLKLLIRGKWCEYWGSNYYNWRRV